MIIISDALSCRKTNKFLVERKQQIMSCLERETSFRDKRGMFGSGDGRGSDKLSLSAEIANAPNCAGAGSANESKLSSDGELKAEHNAVSCLIKSLVVQFSMSFFSGDRVGEEKGSWCFVDVCHWYLEQLLQVDNRRDAWFVHLLQKEEKSLWQSQQTQQCFFFLFLDGTGKTTLDGNKVSFSKFSNFASRSWSVSSS